MTAVEIREVIPPPEVEQAMTRQMSAERSRRATVTEAEDAREAAIRVAEGNKQAAILEAEGRRQGTILEAEGYALALQQVFDVAQQIDSKTMSLQYLEMLKALGAAPSTKLVIPTEFTQLLRPFMEHAHVAVNDGDGVAAR